jgi:hypothetical protein
VHHHTRLFTLLLLLLSFVQHKRHSWGKDKTTKEQRLGAVWGRKMEPQRCPGPNLRICEASRMWQGALQMGSEGEQEMVTLSCRVLQCIKYTIVEFTPPPFSFILPSPFVSVENQCITGFIKDGRGERRV